MSDSKAVVFDFEGVLTKPVRASIERWLDADGIDPASYQTRLRAWLARCAQDVTSIHRLETDKPAVAEIEKALSEELTSLDGTPVQPEGRIGRILGAQRARGTGPDAIHHTDPMTARAALVELVPSLRTDPSGVTT